MWTRILVCRIALLTTFLLSASSCGDDDADTSTDGDDDDDDDNDDSDDDDDDNDDDNDSCGPCGSVAFGNRDISGDPRLDGLFEAVVTLGQRTGALRLSLEGALDRLAAAFGVDIDDGMALSDATAAVKAAIAAEISTNVDGSLGVLYRAPPCSASVWAARSSQAACEAASGCSVDYAPSEIEGVQCQGECTGGCSGGCEGEQLCPVGISSSGLCEGRCDGHCQTTLAGAACAGNCYGTCDGVPGTGPCAGACSGVCRFPPADGACPGTCLGECLMVVESDADCEGPVRCAGACNGECTGGCIGEVVPPSFSPEGSCEASADCRASAAAMAAVEFGCDRADLVVEYAVGASLDAQARAAFAGKMSVLAVELGKLIEETYEMRGLVDQDYWAEMGGEPPTVSLSAQLQGLLSAGIDDFDVPASRLPCVIPAFEESVIVLESIKDASPVVIQCQLELVEILNL